VTDRLCSVADLIESSEERAMPDLIVVHRDSDNKKFC
jgi:hypothetical protein